MNISDLLNEQLILPNLAGATKQQVLEEIVEHLATVQNGINAGELLKALLEREKLGSTGIGNGIAIPHGKLDGLSDIVLVFARSASGVPFEAIDGKPIHLIFLLVAPANSTGGHLKALARLSRLLKNDGFRRTLLTAATAQDILRAIADEDNRIAI
jgi:PTS system nitrogen regulatory IIA component